MTASGPSTTRRRRGDGPSATTTRPQRRSALRSAQRGLRDPSAASTRPLRGDGATHNSPLPRRFTKFTGGCGRHAQGKLRNAAGDKVRWPQKATKIVLDLLKNAEANAEMKGLDADELVVKHSQANRAQKQRRRTYRAHGRINPYMSSPAHIEIVLCKAADPVKKAPEEAKPVKLSRKQSARLRIKAGGGSD